MAYDNNSGALFKNDRKKTEKHPDFTGTINVNGDEFYLSGWSKEAQQSGKKFISLSVTPKQNGGGGGWRGNGGGGQQRNRAPADDAQDFL